MCTGRHRGGDREGEEIGVVFGVERGNGKDFFGAGACRSCACFPAQDEAPARLTEADLSGGETKNVILNPARLACGRSPESQVTAQDLHQAATMELAERGETRRVAGFGR